MPTFVVIGFTPAFAAATSVGLEGTVPMTVLLDVGHHVFLLVVSAEAVLTELFSSMGFTYRI